MSIAFPRRDARPRVKSISTRDSTVRLPAGDLCAVTFLLGLTALVSAVRLHYDIWLGRTDLLTAYLPYYAFLGEELRNFNIPGWSPFQASGLPFAGDPQSGWMYLPAMVLYALLPPATAAKAMVVFLLALASLSTYAFARVLGLRPVGSLVAAVGFAFGAHVYHTTSCCTIWSQLSPFLPLGFLGIELSLRRTTWRGRFFGWSLTAFAVSQMMAGWMGQGVYNAALLLGAWLFYRALLSPPIGSPPIGARVKPAVISGLAILVLSLGLSAAGLLPRLEANRSTLLAGGNYAAVEEAGSTGWRPSTVVQQLLDTSDGAESRRIYVGGVTLALAILAVVVARRRHAAPYFAAVALVIPLMVLHHSPLYPIYSLLPRYEELHEHSKFRIFGLFFLAPAMLAGATVDTLSSWLRRRWSLLVAFLPVLLVMLAMLFVRARFSSNVNDARIGWGAVGGALAVALILAAGAAVYRFDNRWRAGWSARLPQAVSLLLLLVLLWEPTGRQLTEDGDDNRTNSPRRQAAIEANLADTDPGGAGEFIQQQLSQGEPFRYFGYDAAGLRTFVNDGGELYHERRTDPHFYSLLVGARATRLRIYDVQGYNPSQSALYSEYLVAVNGGVRQDYHDANILTSGFDSRLLDLLNVRYIIVPRDVPPGRPDLLRLSQLHSTVFQNEQIRVLENQRALPHAWITHDVQEVPHADMLAMLDGEQIDVRETTLVEMGEAPALAMDGSGNGDQVTVTHYGMERMTFQTRSAGNGMLVISEVISPGWNAYIDGNEVPIQAVNYLFRGLPLPAGEHTVELRYEPMSLRIGLAATAATTVGMSIIAVWAVGGGWRRRFGAVSRRSGRPATQPSPTHGAHGGS